MSSFRDSLPQRLFQKVEQISLCLKSSPSGLFTRDTVCFFLYWWKEGDNPCELYDRDFCVLETQIFVYIWMKRRKKVILVDYLL